VASPAGAGGGGAAAADAAAAFAAPDGHSWGVEVTDEDRAVWAAQEALAERLPMVGGVGSGPRHFARAGL
jgi:hypothetical protein